MDFEALGERAADIAFYSWHFNYNKKEGFRAAVLLDKDGKQQQAFETGTYQIAIKVVDNDGLENVEVVKLRVNGVVKSE